MKNTKVLGSIVLVLIAAAALNACSLFQSKLKGTVTIEGESKLGKTITANTSAVKGSGIITFQWKRNGHVIDNSNVASYALQADDKDAEITVTVVYSDNIGSITSVAVKAEGYVLGGPGPGGGIIFYQDFNGFIMADTNERAYYLEAASMDQGTSVSWVNSNFAYTNIAGTATGLGTGRQNTKLMLAADSASPAALAAKNYNGGGQNDWFLPSQDELNELYKNRNMVNLSSGTFWTSSQSNASRAMEINFATGAAAPNSKSAPPLDPNEYYDEWNPAPTARASNVRAIRAF
jgi:hypothetical protein